MTDSNSTTATSGWFQWALRKLWLLGRPRRPQEPEKEKETYTARDLPTLGAPIAIVHGHDGQTIRQKRTEEGKEKINEASKPPKHQSISNIPAKNAISQTKTQTTSQASVQKPQIIPSTVTREKCRPNIFTNTLNKRAQNMLIRDLSSAAATAVAKQNGNLPKRTNRTKKIHDPAVPRPTVPTFRREQSEHTSIRPATENVVHQQRASGTAASNQQLPKPVGQLKLTGFDKLAHKADKTGTAPNSATAETVFPSILSNPQSNYNEQSSMTNTSLGEDIYKSWKITSLKKTGKRVKGIRINPSSSDSSRSPSPSAQNPNSKRKHLKRLYVYSDDDGDIVQEVGKRNIASEPNEKILKLNPVEQQANANSTPFKSLQPVPPRYKVSQSTPKQISLALLLNPNSSDPIKKPTVYATAPQSRVLPKVATSSPVLSPIASREAKHRQITISKTPNRPIDNKFERPVVQSKQPGTSLSPKPLIELMREKYSQASSSKTTPQAS